MHCFASENQTYTGTWLFGVESWKSLKGQENLLLKNLQVKTRVENVWFLSWRIFFVGKCGIQSTNEMVFKRTVTLRASFRFPAIRYDAPTLLSFSRFTHTQTKCPPVLCQHCRIERDGISVIKFKATQIHLSFKCRFRSRWRLCCCSVHTHPHIFLFFCSQPLIQSRVDSTYECKTGQNAILTDQERQEDVQLKVC